MLLGVPVEDEEAVPDCELLGVPEPVVELEGVAVADQLVEGVPLGVLLLEGVLLGEGLLEGVGSATGASARPCHTELGQVCAMPSAAPVSVSQRTM